MLVPIAIGRTTIAGLGQLGAQQLRRVGLGEQLRLEIEPGRQIVKGVGRPGEAIDAAMLAAAIGVDRAVEADVGRAVAGDDRPGLLDRDRGAQRRQAAVQLLARVEPVAVRLAHGQVEAGRRPVLGRAAAVTDVGSVHARAVAQAEEQSKNIAVKPAKAGPSGRECSAGLDEVPAFAGMTDHSLV